MERRRVGEPMLIFKLQGAKGLLESFFPAGREHKVSVEVGIIYLHPGAFWDGDGEGHFHPKGR